MASQKKFSANHFHRVTAYPDVHDTVAIAASAEENPAAPLHLQSLFHQHLFVRGNNSVLHRPRGTWTSGGTSGRIFTVVKNHARLQRSFRVQGLTRDKIKKPGFTFFKVHLHVAPGGRQLLQDSQRLQRNDSERIPGSDCLDRQIAHNVVDCQPRGPGHIFTRVLFFELRIALRHHAKGQVVAHGEAYGNAPNVQVQGNFFSAVVSVTVISQGYSRTQRGVSGKGQLFRGGEDAHTHAAFAFRGGIARQDECGFREIHFPGNGLHLGIAQASTIGKNGKLIAFQRNRGEHIHLDERQTEFLV